MGLAVMDLTGLDIPGSSRDSGSGTERLLLGFGNGQCGQDPEDSAYSDESLQPEPG